MCRLPQPGSDSWFSGRTGAGRARLGSLARTDAADRPYNNNLHVNFWGKWRDYSGASITFLGAHAFDMIQYALGTDDTGPVELWPLEPGRAGKLMFRYANGIEVGLVLPRRKALPRSAERRHFHLRKGQDRNQPQQVHHQSERLRQGWAERRGAKDLEWSRLDCKGPLAELARLHLLAQQAERGR